MAYQPLDKTSQQVRLLSYKIDANRQVVCKTQTVNLNNCPPFTALSYVWGDPKDTITVTLNGKPKQVTKNAFYVLSEFERLHKIPIWIDCLCINQEDKTERTHQVKLMAAIYRNAEQVVAWLGKQPKDMDGWNPRRGFAYLTTWLNFARSRNNIGWRELADADELWRPEGLNDLESLFTHPLWTRRWIIQELVLSKRITFLCGTFHVTLGDLEAVAKAFNSISDSRFLIFWPGHIPVAERAPRQIEIYSTLRTAVRNNSGKLPGLVSVLRHCKGLQSTDPRDHVYAVLSLADESIIQVEPDYSKSAKEVLTDFANEIIMPANVERYGGDLGYLIDAGLRDKEPTDRLNLPSWVPTWVDAIDGAGIPHCGQYLATRSYGHTGVGGGLVNFSDRDKYKRWTLGAQFGSVTTVQPGNLVPLLGKRFVRDQLNELHPTGIPILQALFRTLLLDMNPYSKNRLTPDSDDFYALVAGFLYLLNEIVDIEKTDNEGHAGTFYALGLLMFSRLDKLTGPECLLKWSGQNRNGRSDAEILKVFSGSSGSASGIDWSEAEFCLYDSCSRCFAPFAAEAMKTFARGGHLFFTMDKKGYFGVAPPGTQSEDLVCVIQGCQMPLILRKTEKPSHYILIGACFVLGLMDGEAEDMMDNNTLDYGTLILV